MSAIKNHFHDEINRENDDIDLDYQFEEWKRERAIEERAEEAEFFQIFEKTGTYPF